jgi:hypothetical protein
MNAEQMEIAAIRNDLRDTLQRMAVGLNRVAGHMQDADQAMKRLAFHADPALEARILRHMMATGERNQSKTIRTLIDSALKKAGL